MKVVLLFMVAGRRSRKGRKGKGRRRMRVREQNLFHY